MSPHPTAVAHPAADRVDDQEQSGANGPELDGDEQQKAKDEESLNASVTYEVVRREGEKELERSPRRRSSRASDEALTAAGSRRLAVRKS